MALPHHDAAHGNERGRANAKLLSTQHRGHHHVPARLQAAIGAQPHPVAQPVELQDLMRLRQPHLPGQAGIFDRGNGRGTGATGMARDQNGIRLCLGHTRRDGANARARHQLHTHHRVRVDLLQVINELRQILNRIDIMMRRRADQRDTRGGVAQLGDQPRHLEAGQLAALARLRTLRDLDLDLTAIVQVFSGDTKPARSDLLDGGIGIVAIGPGFCPRRVLTTLATVAARANPVHRDGKRLMRLGRERTQRNAGRQQPLADFGDALHLLQRDGLEALGAEIQQVAQRNRRAAAHTLRIALERLVAVGGHGLLQRVDQRAIKGMRLTTAAQLVQTTHRQRHRIGIPGAAMQFHNALGDAREANARNAGWHAGEELIHQRAGEADRLEIHPAAIGGDDRDAHLGHHLQQALIHRLLILRHRLGQRQRAKQATAMAVGNALLRHIGVDGGGTRADQHGKAMHIEAFRHPGIEAGKGAKRGLDEVGMHPAHGQNHRNGRALGPLVFIGQNHVDRARAHPFLRLAANALNGAAQTLLALGDGESAIHLAGAGTHIAAHGVELRGAQHRAVQHQHVALLGVLVENIAQIAQAGAQRHHPRLAQAVDGWVGDLAEHLPEIMVQATVMLAQHGNWRVIAHAAHRLGAILHHRVQNGLQLLHRGADGELPPPQPLTGI